MADLKQQAVICLVAVLHFQAFGDAAPELNMRRIKEIEVGGLYILQQQQQQRTALLLL